MQTIEQVREDHASIEKVSGDRCAVIVKTAYRPRKFVERFDKRISIGAHSNKAIS